MKFIMEPLKKLVKAFLHLQLFRSATSTLALCACSCYYRACALGKREDLRPKVLQWRSALRNSEYSKFNSLSNFQYWPKFLVSYKENAFMLASFFPAGMK